MNALTKLNHLFRPARLTRGRMAFALIVAVGSDALQFALGPLGWFGVVQAIDVIAMVLTTLAIGFHVLLLPTFVIEFIPLMDMLPTWTGCVVAVLALRKREQSNLTPPPIVSTSPDQVPPQLEPPK